MNYFFAWGQQWYQARNRQRPISNRDITFFLRQFAALITAGIPILQAFAILEKSQEKFGLRFIIYGIKRELQAGQSLAYCMRQYPIYFNELLCQLIYLGEQTGKLENMLALIANNEEKKLLLKQRIKQTLFYPSIILITGLLLMLCMLLFVIPRFMELFQDMQDKLPLITRLIFDFSLLLKKFLWPIAIGTNLLCFSLAIIKKKKILLLEWKNFLINLPILRNYFQKIMLAHFIRNLSIACTASVPILQALQLASAGRSLRTFNTAIRGLKMRIRAGESMHQAMIHHGLFPGFVVQMIKIGEESGSLDSMLVKIADFLEADIEQMARRLEQLLEPLIMIVLGVLIGGLVISMYLPIFKLGSTF